MVAMILKRPETKCSPGSVCIHHNREDGSFVLVQHLGHPGGWLGDYCDARIIPDITGCGIAWEYDMYEVGRPPICWEHVAAAFLSFLVEKRVDGWRHDWTNVKFELKDELGRTQITFTRSAPSLRWHVWHAGHLLARSNERYALDAMEDLRDQLESKGRQIIEEHETS